MLENFLQDLRFAARSLRKNALFSAIAIATFALGIGANTAIFSVVNAVLLRPLPYPRQNRIVNVSLVWRDGNLNPVFTVPEFQFYRDHQDAFEAMAGFRGSGPAAIKRRGAPEWIKAVRVTDGFFETLGVKPAMGRGIEREETRPGAARVAVLTDSLWRSAFASDPAILGRQIEMNDELYSVAGVMPPGFMFVEEPADIFVALQLGQTMSDTGMNTRVIARLNPAVTLAQGQANMNVMFEDFRRQGLAQKGQRGVEIEIYQRYLAGDFRASLLMLFAAVGLLLLIACANVASLLMARASARQREISLRLALGAGRGRLLQQFLAESLLIAIAGAAVGVLAADWAVKALASSIPWDIPFGSKMDVDLRALTFASLLVLGTSVAFGLTSYWQSSRLELNASLKERGAVRNTARSALVIGEVALSLMLSIGAGLLIESIYHLHQQKLGFDPAHVYTMTTPFAPAAKLSAAQTWSFEQNVLARLQSIPGVSSAAVVTLVPLGGHYNNPAQHEGHPDHSIGGMEYRAISPRYFETMRIPLIVGRDFRESDTAAATPVVIVSETVARKWWSGRSPIGDRVVVGEYQGRTFKDVLETPREVVGVAGDVKNLGIDEEQPTTIYVPASQLPRAAETTAWVVRASGSSGLGAAMRAAIAAERADQRVLEVRSMPEIVAHSVARPTFNAVLMSAFAALALALTSVGIYGLLSFQVMRRTREIGVRMALGAKRRDVVTMVVRQGVALAAIGIGIGIAGAVGLTRFLTSLLSGVRATDLTTYIFVSTLLLAIAAFASYVPARRASKVDPLIALRHE
jgi:putative ABC transport system permease protein